MKLGLLALALLAVGLTASAATPDREWTPLLDPALPTEPVVVRGEVGLHTYERFADPKRPEALPVSRRVIVLATEKRGLVTLDLPGVPTIEPGSILTVEGGLHAASRLMRVDAMLEAEEPTIEARTRIAAGHRRRAAERAGADAARLGPGGSLAYGPSLLVAPAPLKALIIPTWCPTFGNMPTTPTPQDYESFMDNTVAALFKASSNGARSFIATSTPWLQVCYANNIFDTPQEAARNNGYLVDLYDRVIIVWAHGNGPAGVASDIPGNTMVVEDPTPNLGLWAHELGHLEGLVHSNGLACDVNGTPVMYDPAADCESLEYGDPSSPMGDNLPVAPVFSAADRDRLGWWLPGELVNVPLGPQSYKILPMSVPPYTSAKPRALRVDLPSGMLYVEQREPSYFDSGLQPFTPLWKGIQLRVVGGQIDVGSGVETRQSNPNLLDGKPVATYRDHTDAALDYGQSYVTPEGGKIYAAAGAGGYTNVWVNTPSFLAPSQPRNVTATLDPQTGDVTIAWDRPTHTNGAASILYTVRASTGAIPGTTLTSAASSLSVVLGPVVDGVSSYEVSAAVNGNASEYAGSNLVWAFSMVQPPYGSFPVDEDHQQWTITHTLSFPWAPTAGADRLVAVDPPSGYMYTAPAPGYRTITPSQLAVDVDVIVHGDGAQNPPNALSESFAIYVVDQVCQAGFMVPECLVPRKVAEYTILDDD